jgi:hypothetical protein
MGNVHFLQHPFQLIMYNHIPIALQKLGKWKSPLNKRKEKDEKCYIPASRDLYPYLHPYLYPYLSFPEAELMIRDETLCGH